MDFLLKPLIAKFERKLELIANDIDFLCNRVQEIDEKLVNLTNFLKLRSPDQKPTGTLPSPPSRFLEAHDGSNSPSRSTESNGTLRDFPAELVSV